MGDTSHKNKRNLPEIRVIMILLEKKKCRCDSEEFQNSLSVLNFNPSEMYVQPMEKINLASLELNLSLGKEEHNFPKGR